MATFVPTPKIDPAEYDEFFKIMHGDLEFPPTHGEWVKYADKKIKEYSDAGRATKPATIHPKEFSDWCEERGFNNTCDSLYMFAIAKPQREAQQ